MQVDRANVLPPVRKDLDFFPIQHGGQHLILIRDPLGLVEEGKALPLRVYELMAELDGAKTIRDLQTLLMRQKGGILVGSDEVERIVAQLDELFLLDTQRYRQARERAVAQFSGQKVRPCSHSGRSYPASPDELRKQLDDILACQARVPKPTGKIQALVAPHIDLSVGTRVYSSAYQWVRHASPSRIFVLGVGHQMMGDLFCLTDKDFETPLGVVRNDQETVKRLEEAGRAVLSENDFPHKSEHSIEFQLIFLQHLLRGGSFTIVPIMCGPVIGSLAEYNRKAYLEKAGPFLQALARTLDEQTNETLIVAGVDFSHIGPKFGHDKPAVYLESQLQTHDQNLLKALCERDKDAFWEESIRVADRFNVCGFSAMAALLEILPVSSGQVLNYQIWHEEATRSAVSFAAVVFLSSEQDTG